MKRLSSTDQNSNSLVNLPEPTNPQDAATKAYVDANAGGGGSSEYLYPKTPSGKWLHAWVSGFVTNQPPSSGYVPIQIGRSQDFDAAGVNITTGVASATVKIALYADDGGYPGSLIADFGTVDASTSGAKTLTLGSPISLAAGLYWMLAIINDSTLRLAATAHTTYGQPAALWHGGPAGANTTVYHGGYGTTDTSPPATASAGMITDRYITISSLRAT